MPSFEASHERAYPERGFGAASTVEFTASDAVATVLWAGLESMLHRVRRGEGALLAINLSLIAYAPSTIFQGFSQALVSTLAIVLMYAFNDFYDAPTDWNNPKKDRRLVATYLEYRRACGLAIFALTLLTIALAFATLGSRAGLATMGVVLVNVVYSGVLKGVPVVDVAWCALWGALYGAIVSSSPPLLVLVALMTAVCHLYQAVGDRDPDAANAIITTAVRSTKLTTGVFFVLSVLLFFALRAPVGDSWALSGFVPFALRFVVAPHTGWLLSKAYFGLVWLCVLGFTRALV